MTSVTTKRRVVSRRRVRAIVGQARVELLLTLRRGESLLVSLVIPIGILVFFAKVDAVNTTLKHPVDFLVPGVLALAVMSTAMVSLGIATGFERRYGVLKRLGSTPLSRARSARGQDDQRARDRARAGHRHRRRPGSRSGGSTTGGLATRDRACCSSAPSRSPGSACSWPARCAPRPTSPAPTALFLVLLFLGGMAYPLAPPARRARDRRPGAPGRRARGERAWGARAGGAFRRGARRARGVGDRRAPRSRPGASAGRRAEPEPLGVRAAERPTGRILSSVRSRSCADRDARRCAATIPSVVTKNVCGMPAHAVGLRRRRRRRRPRAASRTLLLARTARASRVDVLVRDADDLEAGRRGGGAASASSSGNSWRQGWHHDAQKLTTTGRPRSDASDTVPPSSVGSVKSGAARPTAALAVVSTWVGTAGGGQSAAVADVPSSPPLDETATTVIPVTSATTTSAMTASSARRGRRGSGRGASGAAASGGADEGVDGNGREQQGEIRVREHEEPDRARRGRVAAAGGTRPR